MCSSKETKQKTTFIGKYACMVIIIVFLVFMLIKLRTLSSRGTSETISQTYKVGEKIQSFENRIKTLNIDIYNVKKYNKNIFSTDQQIVNRILKFNKSNSILSIDRLQRYLYKYLTNVQYKCIHKQRFGNVFDGGYDICLDTFKKLKGYCIVYSFGINNDFSFDDDISKKLECEVHSFDPSMEDADDHVHSEKVLFHKAGLDGSNYKTEMGWMLYTFSTIRRILDHTHPISVVKIDIELSEWPVLQDLLETGEALLYIKQLAIEIHTPKAGYETMTVNDYLKVINLLTALEDVGFKRFLFHTRNNCCGTFATLVNSKINRLGKPLCCFELFYVNKRFL